MLKLARGDECSFFGTGKRWLLESQYLRQRGLARPEGFTFTVSQKADVGNFFWTSNEFAAYLAFQRYGEAELEVEKEFQARSKKEKYLYDLSSATTIDRHFKVREGASYRSFQLPTIEYGLSVDNLLIADEQRVGKTAGALGIINNRDHINKILIVCPKTAKFGWIRECQSFLVKDYKIQSLETDSILDLSAGIYIIHYDILDRFPQLKLKVWDVAIVDEIHLCKKIGNLRTDLVFQIKAHHKLGLSGTALPNIAEDFLTVLKWIDDTWLDWRVKKDRFIHKSGLTLTLEEVNKIARSTCMIRRLQADVFKNEPIEKRFITIDPPEEFKKLILAERYQLSDYGGEKKRILGLAKVPYALKHIDTYTSEGEKMVVFCWHQSVIQRLASSLGNKCVVLYGNSSAEEREHAKYRFTNDPKCSVFIGSLGAASMAISLAVANHMLFVEADYRQDYVEQALFRCSDYLQDKPILAEFLIFEDSLDEHIAENNSKKKNIARRGLDKNLN